MMLETGSFQSPIDEKETERSYSTKYEISLNGKMNQSNTYNNVSQNKPPSPIYSNYFPQNHVNLENEASNKSLKNINQGDNNNTLDESTPILKGASTEKILNKEFINLGINNEIHSEGKVVSNSFAEQPEVFYDNIIVTSNFNTSISKKTSINVDGDKERKKLSELKQEELEEYSPPTRLSSTLNNSNSNENKVASQISVYAALGENMCIKCEKRVYEMEKITVDNVIFHKTCFRCVICKRMLSLGNYSTNEGQMYCKPDFLKSFKERGNYSFSKDIKINEESSKNDGYMEANQLNGHDGKNNSEYMHNEYPIKSDEMPSLEIKTVRSLFEKNANESITPIKASTEYNGQSNRLNQHVFQSQEGTPNSVSVYENHHPMNNDMFSNEIVQSSNECVRKEELPPQSITKNVRAIFEKGISDTSSLNINFKQKLHEPIRQSSKTENISQSVQISQRNASSNFHSNEQDQCDPTTPNRTDAPSEFVDELPPAGTTGNLLAQWKNLEVNVEKRRGRDDHKTSPAIRSQSLSRIEYMNRQNVKSQLARSISRTDEDFGESEAARKAKERLARYREIALNDQREQSATKPKETPTKKSFKWEVKEPVPMNRGVLIVHGDVPRHLHHLSSPVTSPAIVHEEENHYSNINEVSQHNKDRYLQRDIINPDEMPDPNNIRSALQRFKDLEDANSYRPAPQPKNIVDKKITQPVIITHVEEIYEEIKVDDDFPTSGTTRNLLAKFQQMK